MQTGRATAPDLLAQLRAALRHPVDTVLCSCLDEDPLLRPNAVMTARFPHAIAMGMELLGKLLNVRRAWAVLDVESPRRWSARARRALAGAGVRILTTRGDYPRSDPTLLLHCLTKRRLRPHRPGGPAEVGVLLLDAAAAAMVGLCMIHDMIDHWPCAIRDHITGECHYLAVGHGRLMGHVLHEGAIHPAATVLWAGRPLRDVRIEGHAMMDGREIAFHAAPPCPTVLPHTCVRCGWCLEACPVNLNPARLLQAAQSGDGESARKNDLEACIECGLCTYVCPSQLPLLEGIRSLLRPPEMRPEKSKTHE